MAFMQHGAWSTSEFALDQGRELFADPGKMIASQSKGPNGLLRNGTLPLTEWNDMLEVFLFTRIAEQKAVHAISPADFIAARLVQWIGRKPVPVDEIRNMSGWPIEKVSAALTLMELTSRALSGRRLAIRRSARSGLEYEV